MKIFKELEKNEYLKFYKSLHDARIENKHGCFVSLETPEFFLTTRNFLLDEGIAGFAITDKDNLVAVHKNSKLSQKGNYKNIIDDIMLVALKNGACTMDCYGDFLADTYMKYGFLPTGRMFFDINYNLDWDINTYGTPDVIVLGRAVSSIDEVIENKGTNNFIDYYEIKDKLPIYTDYEKMLEDRDKIFNIIKNKKFNYNQSLEFIEKFLTYKQNEDSTDGKDSY